MLSLWLYLCIGVQYSYLCDVQRADTCKRKEPLNCGNITHSKNETLTLTNKIKVKALGATKLNYVSWK